MQEPFGAFTWYTVNDQPSDKALYDIAVTAPPGWAGIASGTPAGRDGNTFRYRSTDPVASYMTTLAVGPYRESVTTGPHGLPIHLWYRDSERQYLPMLKHSGTFLNWLEQHFGPYPLPERRTRTRSRPVRDGDPADGHAGAVHPRAIACSLGSSLSCGYAV